MPGFVAKTLHKFQHMQPNQHQNSSHDWTVPYYGYKFQCAHSKAYLPNLDPYGTQLVQSITGTLLQYY